MALKRKLAKHALAEEDVVYPMLHDDAHEEDESKHLYGEHADMKIFLFELEAMLKSGEDWTERVRSLRHLIKEHADEEEQKVFPRLRQTVGENKLPDVKIRREEALIL